jgi:dTDP-4-dehydrorhamnose 3,5-epimerase
MEPNSTLGIAMFCEGIIQDVVTKSLERFEDDRGWLVELFREDEISPENLPCMAYVSQTLPGVARGPHQHQDQSDFFAFVGPGDFKLYMWDVRPDSPTRGTRQTLLAGESNRQSVIVPAGVVHGYKNVSPVPGLVFNAPNRLYAGEGKKQPVDEIRYEDLADSPYVFD